MSAGTNTTLQQVTLTTALLRERLSKTSLPTGPVLSAA